MAKRMAHSRMARFAVFWFNVFALVIFTNPVSASSTTIPTSVQGSSFITPTTSSVAQNSTLAVSSSISSTVQNSTLAFTSSISRTAQNSTLAFTSSISPTGASATTYSPSVPSSSATLTPQPTTATPSSSSKPTNMWDKAIDLATPLGTFIIVIVAVALVLILLIALICVCCKYRRLKKRTHLFDHMTINESEWIRSNDDLLMWERNLRASEVKTNNGVSNRPLNEKRS